MHIRGVNGRFLVKISCHLFLLPDSGSEDRRLLDTHDHNSTLILTIVRHLLFLHTPLRYTYC